MFCCAYSFGERVGRERRELRVAVPVDDLHQPRRGLGLDIDAAEKRADQPRFLRGFIRRGRRHRHRRPDSRSGCAPRCSPRRAPGAPAKSDRAAAAPCR